MKKQWIYETFVDLVKCNIFWNNPTWALDFENSRKKGCFHSFEWQKTNLTTVGHPLRKILEKSPCGKNPSDTHAITLCKFAPWTFVQYLIYVALSQKHLETHGSI